MKFSEWLNLNEIATLGRPVTGHNAHVFDDGTVGLIFDDGTSKKVTTPIKSMKQMVRSGSAAGDDEVWQVVTQNTNYLVHMPTAVALKIKAIFDNYMRKKYGY